MRRRVGVLAVAVGLVLTSPALASAASGTPARLALGSMTLEQRVGQLFLVGTPADGAASDTVAQILRRHVGNVMLTGRSSAGVGSTAGLTNALQASATRAATASVPLLVATDQEGGRVQVLTGPGFSTIPSALDQGSLTPATLRARAATWGSQLRAAGVTLDLAPVSGTVPSRAAAAHNPPIGVLRREYGFTPGTVAAHADAFALGLADAGVSATAKHFPGLGRVTGNTDTQSGVTDTVTVRHDPYVMPFQAAVSAGVPALMMSTAVYSRIDPNHPAAFSPTVVTGMVRGDLGFTGIIVSDDLGKAAQVASVPPASRALQFLSAGGDLVLTVEPSVLPAMYDAVLAKARQDPAFRARVDASALRVLEAKAQRGLLARRDVVRQHWWRSG